MFQDNGGTVNSMDPLLASITTMDPTASPPVARVTRKRKTPPAVNDPAHNQSLQPPPPPAPEMQTQLLPLPSSHALIHPHMQGPPPPMMPHYTYAPPQSDYSTGGHQQQQQQQQPQQSDLAPQSLDEHEIRDSQSPPPNTAAGRALSSSKRAEQNRKAQRAFRERRDQRVQALESRSQLLEAALASADEANRRWEECRTLVDQLRVENAGLRAHIQMLQGGPVQGLQLQQIHHHQQQQPQQTSGAIENNEESVQRTENGTEEAKSDQAVNQLA